MLSETARVIAISDGQIQLLTSRKTACNSCAMKSGCGRYLFSSDEQSLWLPMLSTECKSEQSLKNGALVNLSIPANAVAKLALLFYTMPLVLLLTSTLIVSTFTSSELWLACAAITGLLSGLWVLPFAFRILESHMNCRPVVRKQTGLEFARINDHEG